MKESKIKNYLEIITSIAVVLTTVLMLWIFISSWAFKPSGAQVSDGLSTGNTLARLPDYNYSDADKTLIIALSTRCRYCAAQVAFFNQLAVTKNNDSMRVLAVFPESGDEVDKYVLANNLTTDTIAGIELRQLNLEVVPAVIIVDREGRILNFWVGNPSEGIQREITEAIK